MFWHFRSVVPFGARRDKASPSGLLILLTERTDKPSRYNRSTVRNVEHRIIHICQIPAKFRTYAARFDVIYSFGVFFRKEEDRFPFRTVNAVVSG